MTATEWLPVGELADKWSVTRERINQLIRKGFLVWKWQGNVRVISAQSADRLAELRQKGRNRREITWEERVRNKRPGGGDE
jgi:hypothetical protein